MGKFIGTGAFETISPSFVSPTVAVDPGIPFPGGGADLLIGNGGNDLLIAAGGNDQLNGGTGNDTLEGDEGNDTLIGGPGADKMSGGAGADSYSIDNSRDRIIGETATSGFDTVTSSIDYTLGADLENLFLTGNAVRGTGNAGNNTIVGRTTNNNLSGMDGNDILTGAGGNDRLLGGEGNDRLDGGTGADRMDGGAGDDLYVVDDLRDVVTDTAILGIDTVQSLVNFALGTRVENLNLAGGAKNGTGNAANNIINGTSGVNVIDGKAGSDTLRGFTGNDTFRFTTNLGATNIDHILDYTVAADTIELENAVFTGLAAGMLFGAAFFVGAAAHDVDDRIIYNAANGALIFDSNGNAAGGAVQFATVAAGLAMTNNEFFVT